MDISGILHILLFKTKTYKMKLEKGYIIISIDVDVGDKELGLINKGKNDRNVNDKYSEYIIGQIEEQTFPFYLNLFNAYEIPVTFALRGQLLEINDSIITKLRDSSIKYDIASHGYYHMTYGNLFKHEAETELNLLSNAMKRFDLNPESFVFPKNNVSHLDLLEKYGYKCYRGSGGFPKDDMYIERNGRLFNVHPSLCIDKSSNPLFIKKIIDISISKKLPFHIWFHLWSLGDSKESIIKKINNFFIPVFEYAKKKEKLDQLSFETMASSIKKLRKSE